MSRIRSGEWLPPGRGGPWDSPARPRHDEVHHGGVDGAQAFVCAAAQSRIQMLGLALCDVLRARTEGLGAIYPAMMYFIMALDALGYPKDHPDLVEAIRHFESCSSTRGPFIFQPCVSPTVIPPSASSRWAKPHCDDARMTRAADWLISKRCARKGDWSVKRPDTEPPAGPSSSPTSFYRISTTPPWCCWRCSMQGVQSRGPGGRRAPRHQLAAGHAIGRRRLGGIRRR